MLQDLKQRATELVRPEPRYHWWHVAGIGLAANAVYRVLIGPLDEKR